MTWLGDAPGYLPHAVASDDTTISGTSVASGGTATVTVTFPVDRFTVAPQVFPAIAGFVAGSGFAIMRQADQITTTGCRLVVTNVGTAAITFSNLPVRWVAVQMTPTSASG